MSIELVETIEVGSGGAASITFSSITSGADHLLITLSARATADGDAVLFFNGDTSYSSYNRQYLTGNGSSAYAGAGNYPIIVPTGNNSDTANIFSINRIFIPHYTDSNNKMTTHYGGRENNATSTMMNHGFHSWSSSSAITSVTFTQLSGVFAQYSKASLYKISAS